jgi:hypothetical protein
LTATNLTSTQRLASLGFSTQLGRRTFASVAVRRTQFESAFAAGFRENALIGTVTLLF